LQIISKDEKNLKKVSQNTSPICYISEGRCFRMNSLPKKIMFICFMILLLSIPSFANSNEIIDSKELICPRFAYINLFQNHFDISDYGKASISVYLNARDVDQVKVVANLQQYRNGNWRTIKSWSAKSYKDSAGVEKNYYISSGYLYRLKCYGYVYVNDRLVEMDRITSKS